MITKVRRAAIMTAFHKQYGKGATYEFEESRGGNSGVGVLIDLDPENPEESYEKFDFFHEIDAIPGCCGVQEMSELGPLCDLDEVGVGLFELWLSDEPPRGAMIIATTATYGAKSPWGQTERVLLKVGFTPAARSNNLNSRNEVTLWYFLLTPSSLPSIHKPTPKKKEKKSATVRTIHPPRTRNR